MKPTLVLPATSWINRRTSGMDRGGLAADRRRATRIGGALLALVLALYSGSGFGGEKPPARVSGSHRTPWTSSRIHGTPEPPPPYRAEPAFPRLTFQLPVVVVAAPGSPRLFVGELKGKLYSFRATANCAKADLLFDLAKVHPDLTMNYGLVFHPNFATNHYLFVCFATKDGTPDGTKVIRYTVRPTEPPTVDPKSEKVILTWLAGGHNGGCLLFGNDGCLYISTGDGAGPSPPDPLRAGQDMTTFLSKILRIDVDHADPGKAYRVPSDNPFVGLKGARPEIWAYGLRNPWKMSFDKPTGDLWVGDVGWELWELLHRIERGGNYGWSIVEGRQSVHPEDKRGPTPVLAPLLDHPHSESASITGGYVYHGHRLPELRGAYIYGDFQTGKVWGLRLKDGKIAWHPELANTPLHLVAFGEDNTGELYLVDHDRTQQLYQLAPNPAAAARRDFPRRLSQTGLFASTKDQTPAPGVLPYTVNAEFWADHTHADRFLAIPGKRTIQFGEHDLWELPEGSVLARTVWMETEKGPPARRQRIETQLLHFEDDAWRPYTYRWNDEQTDAALVDAQGTNVTLRFADPHAPGGQREQGYRIAGRAECLLCHNPWAGRGLRFGRQSASPLTMNVWQLNRAGGAGEDNQLYTLEQAGYFARPLGRTPENLPKLANPYEETADLNQRARSYFQVNCAHCHQFGGGGTANIQLGYSLKLEETKTLNVPPSQGTFGIAGARIIAPGNPDRSVLYYRIAKLGGGRMPRLGSTVVDEQALDLLYRWIAQLPRPPESAAPAPPLSADDAAALATLQAAAASPPVQRSAIERLTASTRGALQLLRLVDHGGVAESVRQAIIAATKAHPQVEVRDLFERFIPERERVQRLGAVVNPAEILALGGSAEQGRQVFFNHAAALCKNCHRVQGNGTDLGPDLSKIGAKYSRAALLEQILEPSKVMEPKYVPYILEAKTGEVYTGLLVERSDQAVVLKDAQNKTIRVPADQVERLAQGSKSLMPDLLLRDLTAQQVADLLEFLTSLK